MIYRCLLEDTQNKRSEEEYHLLGEKLLSLALYEEEKIVYKREDIIKNQWGKPRLKNHLHIHYSITHSYNLLMCVISELDVGIDVEKIREFNHYAALKVCREDELHDIYKSRDPNREFFKYWTLKESYIKAIGRGLSYAMKKVNFIIESNEKIYCNKSNCSFQIIEDSKDYIAAICLINY